MKVHWRRDRLLTPVSLGFPFGSAGKESACNSGDLDSIPGLGRSPGEGKGYPLQYPGLENSMHCTVHGFAKSRTRLSDFHFCKILNIVPCAIQVGPFCLSIIYSSLYLLGFPNGASGKEPSCQQEI